VVRRKLLTNLDLLLAGPHTIAALLGTVVLTLAVLRPPAVLARAYAEIPPLRPGLLGAVTLGLVGAATNDSGVAIPALVGAVVLPATLAVCLLTDREPHADTDSVEVSEPVQVLP
jgi:hypothetical protein